MENLTTVETAISLGLTAEEFEMIKEALGRVPNYAELSVYSVMWSEHCSYKNSIVWLKTLPKEGPYILAEAGEENAGLVDIGDGLACAFKIESHNHPSAIEPYHGAATGVGGIARDIFSMGALPIASLNSLRLGNINTERTKWLNTETVKGMAEYGRDFGVPTVGGEIYYEDCYETNNLVNAMCIGIAKVGETISAVADGVGNPVYIYGAKTGMDGIHGAAFASKENEEVVEENKPLIPVGNPIMEKAIMESSMELIKAGVVVGMQDMGAAGIACSTSEMSAKSETGMDIWLDKVPVEKSDMKGWEMLLSESQERMLVVINKGDEAKAEDIFSKYEMHFAQIGVVTDSKKVKYFMNGELEAAIPAESLVLGGSAPVYHREWAEPAYMEKVNSFDKNSVKDVDYNEAIETAKLLAGTPNIASKKWIYEQFDGNVSTKSDASIVKIEGTNRALAMTIDCNSRYVYADPKKGTEIAVAEAARNIVCSGGVPSAISNCLNYGNPYDKGVYYQFKNSIDGMREACLKFKTPVTGGNVSFYNQSTIDGSAVFPTPAIGMIGLLENQNLQTEISFKNEGDLIFMLGKQVDDINCSQYLVQYRKVELSPAPYFNLDEEWEMQEAVKKLIREGLVQSAHDISEGGLFVSLIESSFQRNLGFEINSEVNTRLDSFLFGEAQGRVVISVKPEDKDKFLATAKEFKTDVALIGSVKGNSYNINSNSFGNISDFKEIYDNAIGSKMK